MKNIADPPTLRRFDNKKSEFLSNHQWLFLASCDQPLADKSGSRALNIPQYDEMQTLYSVTDLAFSDI